MQNVHRFFFYIERWVTSLFTTLYVKVKVTTHNLQFCFLSNEESSNVRNNKNVYNEKDFYAQLVDGSPV